MASTVWFQNGQLPRKWHYLQGMCSSQPVLKFRPVFTSTSWYTDPFVLFQNSIRHEVQDLYIMLRKAALRIVVLKTSHAIALQKWLVDFSQVVSLYFLVQEKVIYPRILARTASSDRSMMDELRKNTQLLMDGLLHIHKQSLVFVSVCQSRDNEKMLNFDSESLHVALQHLSRQVFKCTAELEVFFSWELKEVAPEVRDCMTRGESRALQQESMSKILSHRIGEYVYGAYSHWVPEEHADIHLANVDRFKTRRLRSREKKWLRTHKAFQLMFASNRAVR